MPKTNYFFAKLKQVNREYVLLFIVVILIGLLLHSSSAVSQVDQITFTTFYPSPFGEFNDVTARRFYDFENPARFVDPAGDSYLESLRVFDGIQTQAVIGPTGSAWTVNFNTGDANLNNVHAQMLTMTSAGPPGPAVTDGTDPDSVRGVGKYVWDIAEGMKSTDCKAGDVVIIGEDENKGLVRSEKKFDPRVAGIVSTDPKIYMGSGQENIPLALAGIVKCNVTDENGQIKRGDLLVSSSLPGYAMRAEASQVKPGMLVGKALQALAKGNGQIFVLVNKQ
jgi:hypothetical protein